MKWPKNFYPNEVEREREGKKRARARVVHERRMLRKNQTRARIFAELALLVRGDGATQ